MDDATAVTEHHSLVQVSERFPDGVICLLSALRYHGLTTQSPFAVWLAMDRATRVPQGDFPTLQIVHVTGAAMKSGVEKKTIEGIPVRVYSVAKTVADCFRFRHKIGIDVAIEALRDAWHEKRCTMDDITREANVCRVATTMRPYLAIIAAERLTGIEGDS